MTATVLRKTLGIDNGYLSRVLAQHVREGLVRAAESPNDRREKLLTLTTAGRREVRKLDEQSAIQIEEMLGQLTEPERVEVSRSLEQVHVLLARAERPRLRVERQERVSRAALELLEEYYESINVVKRDDARTVRRVLREPCGALWVAYLDEKPVGCVMLRALAERAAAGECKRLYVRPEARGQGAANALMDALEAFAQEAGLRWLYLDTFEGLKAAVALYGRRGYRTCARYNDNPQATMFLRKHL